MSEMIDTLINSIAKVTIVLHLSSKWNAQTYKDLKKHCVLLPLKIVLHFYLNKNLNNNNGNNNVILNNGPRQRFFFFFYLYSHFAYSSLGTDALIDQVFILFIISHLLINKLEKEECPSLSKQSFINWKCKGDVDVYQYLATFIQRSRLQNGQ